MQKDEDLLLISIPDVKPNKQTKTWPVGTGEMIQGLRGLTVIRNSSSRASNLF